MEGECNVVDITLSDNEDHYECLSLKERLLFLETQKEKHTMPISACPLKKRLHSGSDDAELDSSDKMNEMKPKINECSHDEQPDLVNLLKECYGMNFRDNDKELKKSSSTIPTNAKKPKVKQDMDLKKELAKQEKIKLKEEKMKEKNLMKALKASEKEIQKSKRPDECLKGMKIYIDQSIIYEKESEDIFCVLDESNLRYNIEENSVNMSVIWCRQVVDATVENNEVIKSFGTNGKYFSHSYSM
ncbi:hypothetical protein CEXT_294111 [Caerostris extrusa]|uniref:Uncharacterized protein n=1 Tax=Caerostris extrusa TaxID=172846 RepID=A0AAV4QLM7_CAEEX|nr:hypothetical protein CEXT_294111 [Caerostris extrusa]